MVEFSKQAQMFIGNLKDFNRADFEAWNQTRAIGSKIILEYLAFKEQEKKALKKEADNGSSK